ncbi:unnamed protein product [Peronospora belbahrii]|uniref:Uncharacterized protein n=1 Tax=Peronospora belbahrii TaxID=622444 RepID=A0AAU9KX41_9STRA|nr:unnamed protein product [Peronospora belbahrii]
MQWRRDVWSPRELKKRFLQRPLHMNAERLFVNVPAVTLASKYCGDAEKMVRELFIWRATMSHPLFLWMKLTPLRRLEVLQLNIKQAGGFYSA